MDQVLKWLLAGDVAIQYQCQRDLRKIDDLTLRRQIATKGWGKRFLQLQKPDGHWGRAFYQPKWTSTHYTLLQLKNLGIEPGLPSLTEIVHRIARENKGYDGGISPGKSDKHSDICVNGMFLNYACYFGIEQEVLNSIINYLLQFQMHDGGFNCRYNQSGAMHSSLHTTLSCLEGFHEYRINGYTYRTEEIEKVMQESIEFILLHRLYKSDKTGNIIKSSFLKFTYPSRWYYDIFRCLDFFQKANISYDLRMDDALKVLQKKRKADGKWIMQAKHPGKIHFEMEKVGVPSRWNTLRALRILKYFEAKKG